MTHTEKSLMALHYKACEYDPFAERETAFRLAIREVLAEKQQAALNSISAFAQADENFARAEKAEAENAWLKEAIGVRDAEDQRAIDALKAECERLRKDAERLRKEKDGAYLERNRLVALLASIYPSGINRTAIEGWSDDWHGCVYIDFPWGQASWHYHDSQANLFAHLPPYQGKWDGHTTDQKYAAIEAAMKEQP